MNRTHRTTAFYRCILFVLLLLGLALPAASDQPCVWETGPSDGFALVDACGRCATICVDETDYEVVEVAARMLQADVRSVTGHEPLLQRAGSLRKLRGRGPAVVAGTIGQSRLVDELIASGEIRTDDISGKWEACLIQTVRHPRTKQELLVVAGSDRRGTAFGLTSLCRAIGVSPWYWWADVAPMRKAALYIENGRFVQDEPAVQYRGIFINDERFGGWAKWVEQTLDKEHGEVGPAVYEKVFELLLRLRGNYLWPAMHPGTQAFNADPENARLADKYAIVMGTSHCEQMLRNNEGEWKAVDEQARREGRVPPMGDFNYITNRQTMLDYWETRVRTNGQYENTYTLGLRGIHDYPMEGANTTEQRVALMQQAIDDQREMLKRNIDRPIEEIPQVLCTYEEVLEAYHNGLRVPDDVTLLWSDDKHGYCRNLSNESELLRRGGAGIYYHISYHGDPASWIWLSPLSPAFMSTELTKAYHYGASKIWIFNVGDIKPAEKEISFVMDMAWDLEKWRPEEAHRYTEAWAEETFGREYAAEIDLILACYYRLMAGGKDSHVWFVEYTEDEINARIRDWRRAVQHAQALEKRIPEALKDAYFELVLYPVKGAQMLNEYQLFSRLSMRHAAEARYEQALAEGKRVEQMYDSLNEWTRLYNEEIRGGKWQHFFCWVPYHWYYTEGMAAPRCTEELCRQFRQAPSATEVSADEALSSEGAAVMADRAGRTDVWIRALTPVRNFSKAPEDNVICRVECGTESFLASATPINNVWHSPLVGPMWSRVGTVRLSEGENRIRLTDITPGARIDSLYLGAYPPLPASPISKLSASAFVRKHAREDAEPGIIARLGQTAGVMIRTLPAPSMEIGEAPYVEYDLELPAGERRIEVRTLPTLHLHEGRDARYAAQLDDLELQLFSIHEDDFSAEWRLNVLRGYASRSLFFHADQSGTHRLRIYLPEPGIVLQEIRVY